MPITLTIDRERRVVYSALHGMIAEAEFLQHQLTIKSHPQFDSSFSDILDLRGVTDVEFSEAALRELATSESIFSRNSRHVVIAPKGLIQQLAEKFQTLAQQTRPHIAIVRTPEEAYECVAKVDERNDTNAGSPDK